MDMMEDAPEIKPKKKKKTKKTKKEAVNLFDEAEQEE